jgi:hypothetical protein
MFNKIKKIFSKSFDSLESNQNQNLRSLQGPPAAPDESDEVRWAFDLKKIQIVWRPKNNISFVFNNLAASH